MKGVRNIGEDGVAEKMSESTRQAEEQGIREREEKEIEAQRKKKELETKRMEEETKVQGEADVGEKSKMEKGKNGNLGETEEKSLSFEQQVAQDNRIKKQQEKDERKEALNKDYKDRVDAVNKNLAGYGGEKEANIAMLYGVRDKEYVQKISEGQVKAAKNIAQLPLSSITSTYDAAAKSLFTVVGLLADLTNLVSQSRAAAEIAATSLSIIQGRVRAEEERAEAAEKRGVGGADSVGTFLGNMFVQLGLSHLAGTALVSGLTSTLGTSAGYGIAALNRMTRLPKAGGVAEGKIAAKTLKSPAVAKMADTIYNSTFGVFARELASKGKVLLDGTSNWAIIELGNAIAKTLTEGQQYMSAGAVAGAEEYLMNKKGITNEDLKSMSAFKLSSFYAEVRKDAITFLGFGAAIRGAGFIAKNLVHKALMEKIAKKIEGASTATVNNSFEMRIAEKGEDFYLSPKTVRNIGRTTNTAVEGSLEKYFEFKDKIPLEEVSKIKTAYSKTVSKVLGEAADGNLRSTTSEKAISDIFVKNAKKLGVRDISEVRLALSDMIGGLRTLHNETIFNASVFRSVNSNKFVNGAIQYNERVLFGKKVNDAYVDFGMLSTLIEDLGKAELEQFNSDMIDNMTSYFKRGGSEVGATWVNGILSQSEGAHVRNGFLEVFASSKNPKILGVKKEVVTKLLEGKELDSARLSYLADHGVYSKGYLETTKFTERLKAELPNLSEQQSTGLALSLVTAKAPTPEQARYIATSIVNGSMKNAMSNLIGYRINAMLSGVSTFIKSTALPLANVAFTKAISAYGVFAGVATMDKKLLLASRDAFMSQSLLTSAYFMKGVADMVKEKVMYSKIFKSGGVKGMDRTGGLQLSRMDRTLNIMSGGVMTKSMESMDMIYQMSNRQAFTDSFIAGIENPHIKEVVTKTLESVGSIKNLETSVNSFSKRIAAMENQELSEAAKKYVLGAKATRDEVSRVLATQRSGDYAMATIATGMQSHPLTQLMMTTFKSSFKTLSYAAEILGSGTAGSFTKAGEDLIKAGIKPSMIPSDMWHRMQVQSHVVGTYLTQAYTMYFSRYANGGFAIKRASKQLSRIDSPTAEQLASLRTKFGADSSEYQDALDKSNALKRQEAANEYYGTAGLVVEVDGKTIPMDGLEAGGILTTYAFGAFRLAEDLAANDVGLAEITKFVSQVAGHLLSTMYEYLPISNFFEAGARTFKDVGVMDYIANNMMKMPAIYSDLASVWHGEFESSDRVRRTSEYDQNIFKNVLNKIIEVSEEPVFNATTGVPFVRSRTYGMNLGAKDEPNKVEMAMMSMGMTIPKISRLYAGRKLTNEEYSRLVSRYRTSYLRDVNKEVLSIVNEGRDSGFNDEDMVNQVRVVFRKAISNSIKDVGIE